MHSIDLEDAQSRHKTMQIQIFDHRRNSQRCYRLIVKPYVSFATLRLLLMDQHHKHP